MIRLARLGSQIILWRIEALQQIERLASRVHHELTHGAEILRLVYEPAFDPLPKPNGQLGLKIETIVDRSGLDLKEIQDGFRASLSALRSMEIGARCHDDWSTPRRDTLSRQRY